jgi:hypothetical protein
MSRLPIIESIFNDCTRRCELCPSTGRCSVYLANREYEERHPDASWVDQARASFADTFTLIEDWCKREGIDFAEIRREADSEDTAAGLNRREEIVGADALLELAQGVHARGARRRRAAVRRRRGPGLPAGGIVGDRHHPLARDDGDLEDLPGSPRLHVAEEDPLQNDWDGSAKLARILVRESRQAWEVIIVAGDAPADSPIRGLLPLLDRLDAGLAGRFPRGEEFVRPGFDPISTPEVAPAIGGSRGS